MGCGSSKVDDLPLVVLCRERRDLIRAAADHRFALASCHASYFRALEGVGVALHRFVQEELTVVPTPSSSSSGAPSSPVLTIPSSEGKAPKSKSGSTAGSGGGEAGGGGSSSSPTSLSHSLSPEGSHLHFSSGSESEEIPEGGGDGEEPYPYTSPGVPSPYYNYMRYSTAIPTMVYQPPYAGYGYTPPYGVPDGYFGGVPVGSAPSGDAFSYYYHGAPVSPPVPPATSPPPPPPPPAPEGSTWDFLDPFGSYEQIYSSYRFGSVPSSPNSSEVREQEGIPDLEEETDPEPMKEPTKGKKRVGEGSGKDPGPSSSKSVPAPAHGKNVTELEDKGSKSSSGESSTFGSSVDGSAPRNSERGSKSRTSGDETKLKASIEEETKKKEVSFELETSVPTEKSGPTLETALSTEGTRNVTEVTKEIKEQFKMAASSGSEVSAMLEVGKPRYQSTNDVFKVISSRILDSFPMLAHSFHSFKRAHHLAAHSLKIPKVRYGDFGNSLGMRSGNLSSTLEKLSVWEKKLYKEVKDEEKLRVIYEKQCRRLKKLDDRGAESYKIDATRASIRKLLTKIDITIKSVDVISSRIHKLRDEELQPQLIELVQGLVRMWKSMLDCHQKQFLAIVESKSRNLMARTNIQRGSVAKITRELEVELLNWLSSFHEWISIQRIYFRTLNEWLQKCLYVEPEETPDGVAPYSPGRIGAPAAFVICNDWCEAMEKICEDEVIIAVQAFAAGVHELWESQDEEEQQKQKAEYLSKDLAGKLRSLQKETGLPVLQDGSSTAVSLSENANASLDTRIMALESIRKRLEEETAKHEEVVKQINAAARTSLRRGLVPIFHALGSFSLETLKAYEKIRIPEGAAT